MLNGDGLRVVLWVAGCDHCCKECHNPVTWDPNGAEWEALQDADNGGFQTLRLNKAPYVHKILPLIIDGKAAKSVDPKIHEHGWSKHVHEKELPHGTPLAQPGKI